MSNSERRDNASTTKESSAVYGKGYRYDYNVETAVLFKTVIRQAIVQQDGDDLSMSWINNTNLHNVSSIDEVPIGAYTLDDGVTNHLGIVVFMGNEHTLIQPCTPNSKGGVSISPDQKVIKFKTAVDNLHITYLNNLSTAPKSTGTERIKCNILGPDRVSINSLPEDTIKAINDAKLNPNNKLVKAILPLNPCSSPITSIPTVSSTGHSKRVLSTSKVGKVAVHVPPLKDIVRGEQKTDGLVTLRYLYDDDDELAPPKDQVRVAYVKVNDASALVAKGTISRDDYNGLVSEISEVDVIMKLHDVTPTGLVFVGTKDKDIIGKTSNDIKRVEAYERDGVTFAEWSLNNNLDIKDEDLQHIIKTTYGDFGFGRPCSPAMGFCWFKAVNPARHVRPTPNKDQEDITKSQWHREKFNTSYIPLLYRTIDEITDSALMQRKHVDPILEKFFTTVSSKLDDKINELIEKEQHHQPPPQQQIN